MREENQTTEDDIKTREKDSDEPQYSQIIHEVLVLRNSVIGIDEDKYVLLKIILENIRDINLHSRKMDEIALMHTVSHALFQVLDPLDIYYIDDENFLFILEKTNKKRIGAKVEAIKKALSRIFKQKMLVRWEIIKSVSDPENLKPFLSGTKMDFFKARQGSNSCVRKKSGAHSFKVICKNFFIAYLIFFNIFIVAVLFIGMTGKNLFFMSSGQEFLGLLPGAGQGLLDAPDISFAPFALILFIGVTLSVLFGLFGMLIGWIMNVENRVAESLQGKMVRNKMEKA